MSTTFVNVTDAVLLPSGTFGSRRRDVYWLEVDCKGMECSLNECSVIGIGSALHLSECNKENPVEIRCPGKV